MIQIFKRRPLEFEVVRWDSYPETRKIVSDWTRASGQNIRLNISTGDLYLTTLEGGVCARPGDFIIRGIEGEVYPVIERRFRALYDEVL